VFVLCFSINKEESGWWAYCWIGIRMATSSQQRKPLWLVLTENDGQMRVKIMHKIAREHG
jgi:hypothetical protein